MPTRVSSLAVQIEAIGTSQVKAALRELGADAERTSSHLETHYGKAARHLSILTNEAVRAGEIGGTALQKILTVGSDMAGMFGVGGAVLGAVSIAGLAIFNWFEKARKAIEAANEEARDFLNTLEHGGLQAAGSQLAELYQGNRNAKNPRDRESVPQLEARRAKLTGDLAKAPGDITDPETGMVIASAQTDIANALKDVNDELARRHRLVVQGTADLVAMGTKNSESELYQWQQEAKKKDAATAASDFAKQLANLKDVADAALTPVNRLVDLQEKARQTREKYGIREPGNIDQMAGDFASNTGAQLDDYQKKHPFDMSQVGQNTGEGLTVGHARVLQEMADQLKLKITSVFGDAIHAGFAAAFSGKGLGGIFKAFSKTVLGGIGQMMVDQGRTYLRFGEIMKALVPFLSNPFTSAWASTAIGIALMGLGTALGAVASGGSAGGGGGGGGVARPSEITNIKLTATSVADAARLGPRDGNTYMIIGQNDPAAQRQLRDMVHKAERG